MSDDVMVIATWNVNSIRKRAMQVADWLDAKSPDVVFFQETKVIDPLFPTGLFDDCGYEVAFHGQKSYNGVAIASKLGLSDVRRGLPGMSDGQSRFIYAIAGGVRVASVYVPNGSPVGSEKYQHKMRFYSALKDMLDILRNTGQAPVVVGGDYNVAPRDADVYDIHHWGKENIAVTWSERTAHASLLETGYVDAHMETGGAENAFTWWDYRAGSFRNNRGLRIDHFLVAGGKCLGVEVDLGTRRQEEASDHAPVLLEYKPWQ